MRRKKVLLLVVDACTPRVLDAGIAAGRLPNLARLREAGFYDGQCSAIFPSITPAGTASIVTGAYPVEHRIVGAHWFDPETGEVAYYGDDLTVVRQQGTASYLEDLFVGLNANRLQGETIFDVVERAGQRSACINHLVFRGPVQHKVQAPALLKLIPGLPSTTTVPGPSALFLGDFVESSLEPARRRKPRHAGGLWHRLGMDDRSTMDVLIELVRAGLPALTVAYFPDYDFRAHQVGSLEGMPMHEAFDGMLGELYEAAGGFESLLRECCVVLTSDHSMSDIIEGDKAELPLDHALAAFSIAPAGKPWGPGHDIKVCVNMRAAQVYFRRPDPDAIRLAVEELLAHRRVDQAIWSSGTERARSYHVATRDRGRLSFRATSSEGAGRTACDEWERRWAVEGDLAALEAEVDARGVLRSTVYPNPLERIRGALDAAVGGQLWVTAVPGVELTLAETEAHENGGAHGSLHAVDSSVPFLAAGLPDGLDLQRPTRTVDVAPLCLEVLGLSPRHRRGSAHE